MSDGADADDHPPAFARTTSRAPLSAATDRRLSPGVKPLLVLGKIRGILDAFTLRRPMLTLAELRAETGYPTSTVQRLVANLVAEGLLDREGDRYGIGVDVAYWASVATGRLDMVDVTTPVLRRVRDETGETAGLFRAERDFRVCVAMAETRHAIRRELHVGKILPLHTGSSSKVLLAWDADLADRVLVAGLPALTPTTVTDPEVLRTELAAIRATGYAISRDEQDVGGIGVSAPVFAAGSDGSRVVAAIGISGPTVRITEADCHGWADLLVTAAEQVTRLLGGRFTG